MRRPSKTLQGNQPQSGTPKLSSIPAGTLPMPSIYEGVLDAFKLIMDASPSQEHPNHHQLQPKIYKCHQSFRGFLMPSNLSDFNQILNIAPSGHVQTIHNIIKDTGKIIINSSRNPRNVFNLRRGSDAFMNRISIKF